MLTKNVRAINENRTRDFGLGSQCFTTKLLLHGFLVTPRGVEPRLQE